VGKQRVTTGLTKKRILAEILSNEVVYQPHPLSPSSPFLEREDF
jgi:hypothetical protein